MTILLFIIVLPLIGLLMFTFAMYLVPILLIFAVGHLVYETGGSMIGAVIVGIIGGMFIVGFCSYIVQNVKFWPLQGLVILLFAIPSGIFGYNIMEQITREYVDSSVWRAMYQIFAAVICGGSSVGLLIKDSDRV